MQGLVPRPSTTPVCEHLQYAKILYAIKTGGVEGLGMRLCMQLQQSNMLG